MPIFKKKISKMSDYARIFPAKIQNRILLEAVTKISGPKLVDYMKQLDTKAAKQFFNKYPDIKARLNNPLKNKIYPSMLKKVALLTPVFWFGLLPKHEQAKYFQRIKDNLPWNKRKKTQEIKTKTELKSSGIKEVRFGVGNQKVVAGVQSKCYSYKGVTTTASCKQEALAIFARVEQFSEGMQQVIAGHAWSLKEFSECRDYKKKFEEYWKQKVENIENKLKGLRHIRFTFFCGDDDRNGFDKWIEWCYAKGYDVEQAPIKLLWWVAGDYSSDDERLTDIEKLIGYKMDDDSYWIFKQSNLDMTGWYDKVKKANDYIEKHPEERSASKQLTKRKSK